jgi:uncharacterized protein YdcH (DUF465 family)
VKPNPPGQPEFQGWFGEATPLEGDKPRMDRNTQEEIKAHLMQTNERFRQIMEQHHEHDRMVDALEQKSVLTPEEEMEEHRLKKIKLQLKDEMEQIISGYRLQQVGS